MNQLASDLWNLAATLGDTAVVKPIRSLLEIVFGENSQSQQNKSLSKKGPGGCGGCNKNLMNFGATSNLVRLAGLSGALAVGLGAYGAHAFREREDVPRELKVVFDTANRYHLIHSVALIGAPLCHYPKVTAGLLITGMLLFSGTCYYYALTQNTAVRKFTPIGGMLLIAAWLSMAL